MRTSRILCRTAIAALLVSLATPALADRGGHGAWGGGRHGGGWSHHGGGYGHRYHGGGGSSDGWWIGGALALVATGLVLAAANDDTPDYPPSGSYSYTQPSYAQPETGYYYTSPPPTAYSVPESGYNPPADVGAPLPRAQAPVYTPPPAPQPQYQQQQYQHPQHTQPQARQPAAAPRTVSNAPDQAQCQRYAVNYSGYDPANQSAWTTGVGVESYNRALQSCLAGGQAG
ncbi:hypothetical protein [Bordetella genomosp. 13]|uniref:hypothetical protein n=1 Tax=Bordetella genomosp. 13 TaxID=463040 RepID=UPI0011A20441|nr:hypothetical protein [Bordetella genomosp. 13]